MTSTEIVSILDIRPKSDGSGTSQDFTEKELEEIKDLHQRSVRGYLEELEQYREQAIAAAQLAEEQISASHTNGSHGSSS